MIADEKDVPMPSDLIEAYAILSSKRHGAQGEPDHQAPDVISSNRSSRSFPAMKPDIVEIDESRLHVLLCLAWHAWTGACIIWFILCVELTIKWNNISGVDTIRTTGQLIPFIIGIVTSLRAAHQIILLSIKKVSTSAPF
jgi:hypothetical protein